MANATSLKKYFAGTNPNVVFAQSQLILCYMNKSKAIKLAGSVAELAALLGISREAIYQWGDAIPQNRAWQLKLLRPEWFKARP